MRQGQERESRLLSMLEAEQQARRELEQKLLPPPEARPPKPSPAGNGRLTVLVSLLMLAAGVLNGALLWPWLDSIITSSR